MQRGGRATTTGIGLRARRAAGGVEERNRTWQKEDYLLSRELYLSHKQCHSFATPLILLPTCPLDIFIGSFPGVDDEALPSLNKC
jgi:hypothetical protein